VKYLPYFKFDAESWLTGKVQLLPVDEIGIYINLISRIWKASGTLKNDRFLPRLLGASQEQFDKAIADFLELEIISVNEDNEIHIKFINEQLAEREVFISKCSAGGKNKASKATLKGTSSNVQGSSTNLEVTLKGTNSNPLVLIEDKKREEKKIEDKKEDINNCTHDIAVQILGTELALDFQRWLGLWRDTHGNGRDMLLSMQEAQLKLLYTLPKDVAKQTLEKAIRGNWKALHDIRQPRQGETINNAKNRLTGVLNDAPVFGANERGRK
jgi:uncharacterized protein YdaU (DUF1376 family)